MKNIISALLSCIILVGIFTIPVSADETDYSRYIGKWNWENSAPLLENLDNWYTYNEAWVDILSVNGSDVTFKYYHQKGGTHLYMYDICTGSLSGNTVTAVTNARKDEDGLVFAQFRITMTLYDDHIHLESYNLTENGIAFDGKFNPGFAYQAPPGISVKISGQDVNFDVPPQIINDRTMVPMRAIFEALGYSVDWNEQDRRITAVKNGSNITMQADSTAMYYNDELINLDTAPVIINDRTLVPVRAVSESSGYAVKWDEDSRTVYISDINIDYSKYIGEYRRLGGSLGFHWTLNIKNITDTEVVFDFGYEKPNFTYTAEPAVFTDATHAVAHGKRIYEYEETHTETDLVYYLEFTDDGINVNYRESDSDNVAAGTHFILSADKI